MPEFPVVDLDSLGFAAGSSGLSCPGRSYLARLQLCFRLEPNIIIADSLEADQDC